MRKSPRPKKQQKEAGSPAPRAHKFALKLRNPLQEEYWASMKNHPLTFGIGPAGTGKTFLAVAAACEAFKIGAVKKIILVRPVVEAGEHLGFLPGSFKDKLDPYLRPMYDSLEQVVGTEAMGKMIEGGAIEVAPLAFMRGRTITDAFLIMDEAQNTTRIQMKMLLTRIGRNSTFVVNGDYTQVDLPGHQKSGLMEAVKLFGNLEGVEVVEFTGAEIVRHPLVSKMVEIYEAEN